MWPLVLRITGLWLIWASWSSVAGWLLSAADALDGQGYLLLTPVLLGFWILWWRHSSGGLHLDGWLKCIRMRLGKERLLQTLFCIISVLSFLAALLYIPWSFDATTYRLPRCLYWIAANGWYWIGTIDGRLDYSSCGLEWQTVPLILLTKSDRYLFLLSYIPFLLLPGLTYLGGRTLGLGRRALLIWMWLLPCAYCIVLQCSGLQSDGYSASYTVACLAFAGVAMRQGSGIACAFAGIAAALLTGAKLSNLPLMLPLGLLFLVAAWMSGFWKKAAVATLPLMALVSFLPLAVLCVQYTGTWTGDPTDQWGFRTGNPVSATLANLIIAGNDLMHPPIMAGASSVNAIFDKGEELAAPVISWLQDSHRMFRGVHFGDLVYEGSAGPGFSIGCFLAVGSLLGILGRHDSRQLPKSPLGATILLSGLAAWLVLLSQLGSGQSARNFAPYLPLLVFGISRVRPFAQFLNTRFASPMAMAGMLSVLPILILTPARPLIPLSLLKKFEQSPILSKIVAKYEMWEIMRDDLKPMRDRLPAKEKVIGYAGAFRDTAYGLWKPFGSRRVHEIGIPIGDTPSRHPIPDFVVTTRNGIQKRYNMSFEDWQQQYGKRVCFTFKRSSRLEGDSAESGDEWFLVESATD